MGVKPGRHVHTATPDLSAVDRKLLWWLMRYPLQRVEDIMLALGVSANTAYRRLAHLGEVGLVEYVTPPLAVKSACRCYYLSNAGIVTAAAQERADARELARIWGANEQSVLKLLPRLPALVLLQDLINGLIAQAPAMLAHAGGYHADLSWHWIRDYRHTFQNQGAALTCQADGALLLYRKARGQNDQGQAAHGLGGADYYCALFLLDVGLVGAHDQRLIAQWLEALLRYRDSAGRKQRTLIFPPVIVVVQSAHQREVWQHSAADVATELQVAPLTGAIACVTPQEALSSAWTLPWQKLAVAAPCRLRDLFAPLSKEALPAGLFKPRGSGEADASGQKVQVLRGNFAARAASVDLLPALGESQERETVALLGLCLARRHRDVLNLLYAHPLLQTRELAILLGLQSESVARYLYELQRYSCVEKYSTQWGMRWQLTERGLRFLAATHHCALQHLVEPVEEDERGRYEQRGVHMLRKHMQHTIEIYDFFVRLHEGAHAQGVDHAVLWWETGARCERRYRDHGNWYRLRPDATFVYQAGESPLLAWLEWDEEGTSRKILSQKMEEYARYVRLREWAADGWQAPPMLLIVVPAQSHYQRIKQIVSEQAGNSGLLVRVATASSVTEKGPLGAIWSRLIPLSLAGQGHSAAESRPQSLLDLSAVAQAAPVPPVRPDQKLERRKQGRL
jgi:hypothetical protein